MQGISAAILAGGLGTRLRGVVADRPKVLAEIHGRPFLTYLLDQLALAGIDNVVLCTGYQANLVERVIGKQYKNLHVSYSEEKEPLGTGGALRLAAANLSSDPVLVMNGDSYCVADFGAFTRFHRDRQARATLLLTEVADVGRFGVVRTDDVGRVLGFDEKGGTGPGWINAGVYLLSRAVLQEIPEGRPVSLEREMFPGWIGQGMYACRLGGRFIDIGTPESYAEACDFFHP